ncbi:hypothetical protein [Nonomuraea salmonea]|uniref:hypothetical protein n=1 Tax=Nonomuraea salmonea TaxID=46181 RepID=UPI0031E935E4
MAYPGATTSPRAPISAAPAACPVISPADCSPNACPRASSGTASTNRRCSPSW